LKISFAKREILFGMNCAPPTVHFAKQHQHNRQFIIFNDLTFSVFLPEIQSYKDRDVVFIEVTQFRAFRLMKEQDRSSAQSENQDAATSVCLGGAIIAPSYRLRAILAAFSAPLFFLPHLPHVALEN
jgi:hypothetical protein